MAGRSYLFTRRCAQRQFLLRADSETNQAVMYCLGVAAQRYGVELHSVTAMSNHLAITSLDVRGDYPAFLQYLHSLIARCVNVVRSRLENFWSSDEASKVELLDAKAVLDKMVYNLTDPVRQQLVDKVHNWPGVSSLGYQLADKPMTAKRPRKFFRKNGNMPDEVTVHFKRPPEFAHFSHAEWVDLLESRVRAVEQHASEERQARGLRIMGRKAVLRQSPFSFPKSMAPRRNMSPKVAAGDRTVRIAALQRIKRFQQRYREALADVARGISSTLFPYGSYQWVRLGLVRCEPAPT